MQTLGLGFTWEQLSLRLGQHAAKLLSWLGYLADGIGLAIG